jgi:hypothetical protein
MAKKVKFDFIINYFFLCQLSRDCNAEYHLVIDSCTILLQILPGAILVNCLNVLHPNLTNLCSDTAMISTDDNSFYRYSIV